MVSPNQEYLRRGQKIQAFVIHKTEGSIQSALNWCNDPKAQVSYHFIIDFNGDDICLVMPENTAWHAGKRFQSASFTECLGHNPNFTTIGIALAGLASEKPTQAQIAKCAKLLNTLATYYNLTLDKKTVVPHTSIRSDKICPGLYVSIDSLIYLANLPQ
jgi:N-acetyl-anhydromuramyl-L-alanine amidase AmpD